MKIRFRGLEDGKAESSLGTRVYQAEACEGVTLSNQRSFKGCLSVGGCERGNVGSFVTHPLLETVHGVGPVCGVIIRSEVLQDMVSRFGSTHAGPLLCSVHGLWVQIPLSGCPFM